MHKVYSCETILPTRRFSPLRVWYPVTLSLEIILVNTRHDDVVHLEHHAAQLRRQHELLLLPNQRVDDKGFLHVVATLAHAVDTQTATDRRCGLDLLALHLGQRSDRVQTTVLGQCHWDGIQGFGKGPHCVLFEPRRLNCSIFHGQTAGNFGCSTTVYDTVVADEVTNNTESIVERSLGLVDNLMTGVSGQIEVIALREGGLADHLVASADKYSHGSSVGALLDDKHLLTCRSKSHLLDNTSLA